MITLDYKYIYYVYTYTYITAYYVRINFMHNTIYKRRRERSALIPGPFAR